MMLFAPFQLRPSTFLFRSFVRSFRYRVQIVRRMFEGHRHWSNSSNTFNIFFFPISALSWQLNSVFDIYGIDRQKSSGYDSSYRSAADDGDVDLGYSVNKRPIQIDFQPLHMLRHSFILCRMCVCNAFVCVCVCAAKDWVPYVVVGASISGHNVPTAWQIRLTGFT